MRKVGLVALCGSLVAGCAGGLQPTAEKSLPTKPLVTLEEARKIIVSERSKLWKDPYSIRDAKIGSPYFCENESFAPTGGIIKSPASCVCIEANAKNSYGGYTGIRRTIAVFPESGGIDSKDGGILGFQDYCKELRPFAELNGSASR